MFWRSTKPGRKTAKLVGFQGTQNATKREFDRRHRAAMTAKVRSVAARHLAHSPAGRRGRRNLAPSVTEFGITTLVAGKPGCASTGTAPAAKPGQNQLCQPCATHWHSF